MNTATRFLFLLLPVIACNPCKNDGRKVPGGPVVIAADLCDDGDDVSSGESSAGSSSDASGSETTAPTGTTAADESTGECPAVGCDGDFCPSVACVNGTCPGGSFCMVDFCWVTCPCQANPGDCADKPFGGEVWFCPQDAAPLCG